MQTRRSSTNFLDFGIYVCGSRLFQRIITSGLDLQGELVSAYKEEGKKGFSNKLKEGGLLHQDILDALRMSSIEYSMSSLSTMYIPH